MRGHPVTPEQVGCTTKQFEMLSAISRELRGRGVGYPKTPIGAFIHHRHNAARRGIEFKLTLWEWWTIWQKSGRWSQRGRGVGYMMCRKGDVGPYAVGNVFIATGVDNVSTGPNRKSDLPLGVGKIGNRGFIALRAFPGEKRRYLGFFKTPEEAHAAYLAARPLQRDLAA